MKALIYKSTGSWYVAQTEDGQTFNARIKGIFKIDNITSTNPVAVGDEVEITIENEADKTAIITDIHPRRNYIARLSPHNKNQHHIIASNLDQSILFATLKEPRTSQGFIDRFLVSAEAYHIPVIIVFNKIDVYRKKEEVLLQRYQSIYQEAGYTTLAISLANNNHVDELKDMIIDKTTLISGHSGVGKSTFLNTIFPGKQLRTGEVSEWSGKGLHTTTFAEMYNLPQSGRIIDTPGIRELGVIDIERNELSHYFPEMKRFLNDCKFNNCLHFEEPGCAVKHAVDNEIISEERYISYLTILESMNEKSY